MEGLDTPSMGVPAEEAAALGSAPAAAGAEAVETTTVLVGCGGADEGRGMF